MPSSGPGAAPSRHSAAAPGGKAASSYLVRVRVRVRARARARARVRVRVRVRARVRVRRSACPRCAVAWHSRPAA